jgi:hypothetical protein
MLRQVQVGAELSSSYGFKDAVGLVRTSNVLSVPYELMFCNPTGISEVNCPTNSIGSFALKD